MDNPYTSPNASLPQSPQHQLPPGERPNVVLWYKVYAWLGVVGGFLISIVGVVLLFGAEIFPDDTMTAEDKMMFPIMGVVYIVMGLITTVPFFIGALTKQKSWQWTYNLVIICLGLTSCSIVFSLPLLIF
ncbi:MAG: hypothetical protein AAF585_24610, partial [Verrucomicrobiota bacterium]